MLPPLFSALRRPLLSTPKSHRKAPRLRIDILEAREVPAAFTPGNLVVLRVGDGTNTLYTTAAAVSLLEFPTSPGAAIQTINLPSAGSDQITLRGGLTSEGILTRSSNSEYLTFGGYRTSVGTANPTTSASIDRVIGMVGHDAIVSTAQTITDSYRGDSFRSVASDDGSRYWLSGAATDATTAGVRFLANSTDSTTTALTSAGGDTRQIMVLGENLFVSAGDATPGRSVLQLGTGLPTSGNHSFTATFPVSANAQYNSFFLADLDATSNWNSTTFDTLYATEMNSDSLVKFAFDGTNWNAQGLLSISNISNIVGLTSGSNVILYGTTGATVFSLTDNSGFNQPITGNPATIATPGANYAFRGISFAPFAANAAPVNTLPSTFSATEDTDKYLTGISIADPDAASGSIEVRFALTNGGGSILTLKSDAVGGVDVGAGDVISGNGSATVTVTSTLARINVTLLDANGLKFSFPAHLNSSSNGGDVTLTMTTNDKGNTGVGGAKSDEDPSTIAISEVNDSTTANDNSLSSIAEDSGNRTISFGSLTGNDSTGPANESGQTLTIISVGNAVGGTVSISGTDVIFSPTAEFSGDASFDYVVQDNGTTNGAADFSSDTGHVTFTIDPVNDTPLLHTAGTPMLPFIPVRGKVLSASTVAGALLSDLTENITDPPDIDPKGIAVTKIDNANGVWEYNLAFNPADPGSGWIAIPTSVSTANGLLLSDDGDTRVRFIPSPKFKSFASLTFKAWDQSDSPLVEGALDTDLTTTAYSTDDDQAWIAVGVTKPAVDPDGRTILKPVKSDTKTSAAILVKDMLGIGGLESATANLGVAIVGNNTAEGTWEFQLAQTKDWVSVGTVSPTNARLLRPTDKLRFKPAAGVDGDAVLTFKTWDQSTGTAGLPADTTVPGTGFGADPGSAVLDLIPMLNLSAPGVLNPVGANGTTNAVAFSSLMNPNHVVEANVGLAITATKGTGTWEYSLDGVTWNAVGKVSTGKALFLDDSVLIRFTSICATPGTASLSFRAWDLTKVGPGTLAAASGNSVSKQIEIVSVSIANTSPTLDTTPAVTLKPITASARPGGGMAVSTLLGRAFADPDPRTGKGIAITGFTDNGGGKWQYSVGANVWIDLGAVGVNSAALLASNAKVRYLVTNPAITGDATIIYKAWDRTTGQSGDRGVDTTGLLNAFSTGLEETATISITP